jgi:hypothetical protein
VTGFPSAAMTCRSRRRYSGNTTVDLHDHGRLDPCRPGSPSARRSGNVPISVATSPHDRRHVCIRPRRRPGQLDAGRHLHHRPGLPATVDTSALADGVYDVRRP